MNMQAKRPCTDEVQSLWGKWGTDLEERLQLLEVEIDGLAMRAAPHRALLRLLDLVPVELLQPPLLGCCGCHLPVNTGFPSHITHVT